MTLRCATPGGSVVPPAGAGEAALRGRPATARGPGPRVPVRLPRLGALVAAFVGCLVGEPAAAQSSAGPAVLRPCRLPGVEHEAACGMVRRPLDPAAPQGRQIDVHFAVLPALARHKHPDPVFVFAGGPGQSAIELAGSWARLLARVANRRDIVLVDQRGTGRSARLACPEIAPAAPIGPLLTTEAQRRRLEACREALVRLPHGDLRHYTTWVAMGDVEAVRVALGAPQVNLVGGSYGTRAALEYRRQFPQAVRRLVIDGVAPPDMALPEAFGPDNEAALEQVFAACAADRAGCGVRFARLRADWHSLLASLPREVEVAHPLTGRTERFTLTREIVLGLVRAPLYAPALASALPLALAEAAEGRVAALFGLASAMQGGGRAGSLAEGMHYAVVCAEDLPRMSAAEAQGAGAPVFGSTFAEHYRRVCADWPRGEVPAAFYIVPEAAPPTLVLSGGADPVTPPRHGARVARALGAKARHVVVPGAGHGVMALPCMRDVLFRFVDAADEEAALQVQADCAAALPRPPAFMPLAPRTSDGAAGGGR
ncbi:MAG: alpha/beta hydrolase [Rubrivivax sp.]|nr:alpha/beta hydrolase [Rubrivivax sp.]